MNLFASLESAFDREIGSIKPADPYHVHRDHDPAKPNPDGCEFVLTPRERAMAAVWRCQIERNRRELNKRDTVQAMADALVREVQS